MVTDKPPRRTKSNKEPLTIDATTSESEAVAEPVRSNDTDNISDAAVDAQGLEAPPNVPAESTADETSESTAENIPAGTPPSPAEETIADEALPPSESGSAASPSTHPDEETTTHPPSAAGQARHGPAISTLVASGIFGGIVALALAGSMQYAGYLPGGSAESGASEEIAALRQQVEALGQDQGPDPDLQARVEALETAAGESTSDDTPERVSTLEQDVQAIRSTAETASTETASRLDQLQQRLDALEEHVNQPGPEQAAARAITAAALKAAVDQGGAFEGELEAFAATAPDDPAVAQLQPYGPEGVPTQAELAARFSEVSSAILEAVDQQDDEAGIASRLMSSAMSVVKVRRTGEVEGDSAEATVSRIETALKSGNLQAAASAWETLPEEGKTASQDFKQALDARIAVDALIADTVSRAVSETTQQN
ncbi:COG4223 family protein [Rhizobium halophilum]|uniref:COG4223 family protein n=1 Tax=Rhizobium halophilum TaxID=2846852 RepID=UPI001EFDEC5B|nr:mitofilin family membrane protein [Rhizobium halophilum]MCF6368857.1 hypothetical protein [Rhizobium halophilum]